MGYHDGPWNAEDWLAMTMMMFLFWGLVVVLAVWLVRSVRGRDRRADSQHGTAARADEALTERYARGEIDEDEFRRRRELLHSTPSAR